MTGWQDSRSNDRRHTHTPVKNERGENICSSCWQVVIDPIKTSDDPRLQESGFHRAPNPHTVWGEEGYEFVPFSSPLPMILHTLHEDGPEYGFKKAPRPWYVYAVYSLEDSRHEGGVEPEHLWDFLASKS